MQRNKLLMAGIVAAVFALLLIIPAIHFFPGILTCIPGGETYYPVDPDAKFVEGQAFTGEMALDIINVCNNDMFVAERLDHIISLAENKSYVTGDIIAIRYLERNPEISYGLFVPHYHEVLPALEYIIGDGGYEGINMYAFVDQDREHVAYIGYTVRPGKASGNYTYGQDTEGVLIRRACMVGDMSIETLANITIVDTGYNPSANLTEAQEREFVAAALNDSRVNHYLDGFEYLAEINGGSYWWKDNTLHNYIIYYPSVEFLTKDASQSWSFFIRADIDPRDKTVKEFQPPSGIVKYH